LAEPAPCASAMSCDDHLFILSGMALNCGARVRQTSSRDRPDSSHGRNAGRRHGGWASDLRSIGPAIPQSPSHGSHRRLGLLSSCPHSDRRLPLGRVLLPVRRAADLR
jgi:hypothetical protein